MAPLQSCQMEKLVDEALKHNDCSSLENFLNHKSRPETTLKCSKQFLSKLDKLFVREMDGGNMDSAVLVLTVLYEHGKNLVFSGGEGLSAMLSQGLVGKMAQWFEKARELWVDAGISRNEALVKLAEDFFDALMVVHESCSRGAEEVAESLLTRIGELAASLQINIFVQKEAAKIMNFILVNIPAEKKKTILSSPEALSVMNDVASRIVQGGDYDLQASLIESLCRMASPAQRKELADSWFTMTFMSSAFRQIKDSEFETDCRKFLNMINGMRGDKRSVFSYPCIEALLDRHELRMPDDPNLESFWIDFNVGSQSVSLYFGGTDSAVEWTTLSVCENELRSYTVEEHNGRKVLYLCLNQPISVDGLEGSRVTITFSIVLDILQAVEIVYGQAKKKSAPKCSVGKTPIQLSLHSQEGSQAFVPESQDSLQRAERSEPPSALKTHQTLTHPTPEPSRLPQQMVTPRTTKISESCMYISVSAGRQPGSCSSSCVLPAVSKMKPALQMTSSSERKEFELREMTISKTSRCVSSASIRCENNQATWKQAIQAQSTPAVQELNPQKQPKGKSRASKYQKNIPVDKVVDMLQADREHGDDNMVPDSQPLRTGTTPGLWSVNSSKRGISVPGSTLTYPKSAASVRSTPDGCPPRPQRESQKQLHTKVTARLEEVLQEQRAAQGSVSPQPRPGRKRGESVRSSKKKSGGDADHAASKNPTNMESAADGLVNEISSYYERPATSPKPKLSDRPLKMFEFNWGFPPGGIPSLFKSAQGKTEAQKGNRKRKPVQKSFQEIDDVYTFKVDSPTIKKKQNSLSTTSRVKTRSQSNSLLTAKSTTKTLKAPENVKNHLFSDTETDNTPEISWLNSANRKPKPKITDYSRKPVKTSLVQPDHTFETPQSLVPSPKSAKKSTKHKQKEQKDDKQPPRISEKKTSGRPQRAATLTRSYRELSDSNTPPPKRKAVGRIEDANQRKEGTREAAIAKDAKPKRRRKTANEASKADSCLAMKTTPAQPSWNKPLSSTLVSPPSVENMRRKTIEPTPHPTPLRSLSVSSIELDSTLESFSPAGKSNQPVRISSAGKAPPVSMMQKSLTPQQVEPSPLTHSQPRPSPTGTHWSARAGQRCLRSRSSPVSQASFISVGNVSRLSTQHQKTPACHRGRFIKTADFQSGPTVLSQRPSTSHASCLSDEDSDEDKENKPPPYSPPALEMKPRQLFREKPCTSPPSRWEHEQSSSEDEAGRRKRRIKRGQRNLARRTAAPSTEDVEMLSPSNKSGLGDDTDLTQPTQEVDFLCSELKRKIKNHCRKVDLYTSQTFKVLDQHMTSVNTHVQQSSSQTLRKVKQVLLEEMQILEQEDMALKTMEEELTNTWKRQRLAFHTYHAKESQRREKLRSSLQNDVPVCVENEEQIYSTEMCLVKENLKSIQERFFREMQEAELLNVRRGLQSLFFKDGSAF